MLAGQGLKKQINKLFTRGKAVIFEVTAGGTCSKPCAFWR
jgi:hypothetical protein